VQVLLLPSAGTASPSGGDQGKRSRELASLAAIPGTSLVLSADEHDDVVRVVDAAARKVTNVITLPEGAGPQAIAVNTAGTVAVATDSTAKVAYILNENDGTVSIVDLASLTVSKTFSLGSSVRPESIALNTAAGTAYITVPAAGPHGQVLALNLTSGTTTST